MASIITDGESLAKTTIAEITKSVGVRRSCALQISNYHMKLELNTPQQFLYSGACAMPPAPVIRAGYAEACLFKKKLGSPFGCSGMLSYDINLVLKGKTGAEVSRKYNDGTKLYLMWTVPSGTASNYHAVGIEKGDGANSEIYKAMTSGSQPWYQREESNKSIKFETKVYEVAIKIVASISSVGNATWKVDLC